jgi:hypothetical protein
MALTAVWASQMLRSVLHCTLHGYVCLSSSNAFFPAAAAATAAAHLSAAICRGSKTYLTSTTQYCLLHWLSFSPSDSSPLPLPATVVTRIDLQGQ